MSHDPQNFSCTYRWERVPLPKGSFAFVELIIHMTYKVGAHYEQLLAPV